FSEKKIDKNTAIELLISLVDNTDQENKRIECIEYLKKIRVTSGKIFLFMENLLISDLNAEIRCIAANYIKDFYIDKSLSLIEWAIKYESDYNCLCTIIQTLVELNSHDSKSILINMVKNIRKTKYLDEKNKIENKKFKSAIKKLKKKTKLENITHEILAEIIINYLTISLLTKNFYSVYFELENALVVKLDLADVEYEVRGWKADFKNNIKDISEITGLDNLKHLIHLNLSNNQITDIKDLVKLRNLTHLYVFNNKIRDLKNLEYIKDIPNLKYLDLSGNPIIKHLSTDFFNNEKFGNIEIVLKKVFF
ncbi:MAG: leucine-rich repeat domain-containing protein, partial [Promethearchaeota archaeon]